jgi:hypothetical protein
MRSCLQIHGEGSPFRIPNSEFRILNSRPYSHSMVAGGLEVTS